MGIFFFLEKIPTYGYLFLEKLPMGMGMGVEPPATCHRRSKSDRTRGDDSTELRRQVWRPGWTWTKFQIIKKNCNIAVRKVKNVFFLFFCFFVFSLFVPQIVGLKMVRILFVTNGLEMDILKHENNFRVLPPFSFLRWSPFASETF